MRELKFRVWGHLADENYKMQYEFTQFDGYFVPWVAGEPVCDHSLMQFTGLLDKNGVEIYEGDIVDWGILPSVVEWDRRTASFVTSSENSGFICYSMKSSYTEREFKVIGNIHESPELLNKEPSQ